jgi:hypothetical protein
VNSYLPLENEIKAIFPTFQNIFKRFTILSTYGEINAFNTLKNYLTMARALKILIVLAIINKKRTYIKDF